MAKKSNDQEVEQDEGEDANGTELVKMTKEGVTLAVHPSCVKAHIDAGWRHAG